MHDPERSAMQTGMCAHAGRPADVEAQGYQPQEDEVDASMQERIRAGHADSEAPHSLQDEAYWEEHRAQIVRRQADFYSVCHAAQHVSHQAHTCPRGLPSMCYSTAALMALLRAGGRVRRGR